MANTIFIAAPETPTQKRAIKALLEALRVPYKTQKEEAPYNPEFVAKIKRSEKEIAEGKVTKMTLEELDALWK